MNSNINKRDVVGATRLFEAVVSGDTDRVTKLLASGADPNIPENNGITPLMEAASWGRLGIISLLVRHGAKLHACDNFGDCALDYARSSWRRKAKAGREKQKKVIELLQELAQKQSKVNRNQ